MPRPSGRLASMPAIARVLLGLALLLAPASAAAQQPGSDPAERAAMEFLRQLERGAFDSAAASLAPVAAAQMTGERLSALWATLRTQVGNLQRLTPGTVASVDSLRVVELGAHFDRAALRLRVSVTAGGRIAGFFVVPGAPPTAPGDPSSATPARAPTPPPYADTSAFREVEVVIGAGRWQLPGTLSIPDGVDRAPVVVLVHGSGPNDRNQTLGPNAPFRDLAWGLASRGIAVLRYDKRTFAHAGAIDSRAATLGGEVIDDALAALAFVRSRPEVDTGRVFLLGHSLGGMLAPVIAGRDGRLAGAVIMAAPARDIVDVVAEQLQYVASLAAPADRQRLLELRQEMLVLRDSSVAPDSTVLGAPASYWRELAAVDPVARARSLDVPLLVLQGERDYQSTMADFALWTEALGARPSVTLESYPALNHLFIVGEGLSTPAELGRAGHVAAEVVEDIARWIRAPRR